MLTCVDVACIFSNLIHCKYFELKDFTWTTVGYTEVELWIIYIASIGEKSPPSGDVVDLHTIPEVSVHPSDVQREGRGPVDKDG